MQPDLKRSNLYLISSFLDTRPTALTALPPRIILIALYHLPQMPYVAPRPASSPGTNNPVIQKKLETAHVTAIQFLHSQIRFCVYKTDSSMSIVKVSHIKIDREHHGWAYKTVTLECEINLSQRPHLVSVLPSSEIGDVDLSNLIPFVEIVHPPSSPLPPVVGLTGPWSPHTRTPPQRRNGMDQGNAVLTLCVPVVFGGDHAAPGLASWLALVKLQDVANVVVYNHSAGFLTSKILRENAPFVSVVQWKIPRSLECTPNERGFMRTRGSGGGICFEMHYYAQIAAVADCLNRARGRARFVGFVDFDEFLLGRRKDAFTFAEILKSVDYGFSDAGAGAAAAWGYSFRNVFMCPSCLPKKCSGEKSKGEIIGSNVQDPLLSDSNFGQLLFKAVCSKRPSFLLEALPSALFATQRQKFLISNPNERSKMIVDPFAVDTVGVHWVWELAERPNDTLIQEAKLRWEAKTDWPRPYTHVIWDTRLIEVDLNKSKKTLDWLEKVVRWKHSSGSLKIFLARVAEKVPSILTHNTMRFVPLEIGANHHVRSTVWSQRGGEEKELNSWMESVSADLNTFEDPEIYESTKNWMSKLSLLKPKVPQREVCPVDFKCNNRETVEDWTLINIWGEKILANT
ncbi:hypothetical protein HK096_001151, partial [Nowakowskiella sp. JEL0078]